MKLKSQSALTRITIFPCSMWENPPHELALKPRLFGKILSQERRPPSQSSQL